MHHDITETIINSYSDIALGRRSSCGCDSDELWKQDRAPGQGVVKELNLGCGSPLGVAALEPGLQFLDETGDQGAEQHQQAGLGEHASRFGHGRAFPKSSSVMTSVASTKAI